MRLLHEGRRQWPVLPHGPISTMVHELLVRPDAADDVESFEETRMALPPGSSRQDAALGAMLLAAEHAVNHTPYPISPGLTRAILAPKRPCLVTEFAVQRESLRVASLSAESGTCCRYRKILSVLLSFMAQRVVAR